ncbi:MULTISPECIES: hypothetical protein [unclassified Pseudomonas]|uniref:hypothetical protein n=1 Tax=unclassified Pseudomonas TaxID=196821 RepID=UPI00244C7839|nr:MULTISPECIES: hypothetical protein [unclassified Pseudomonas]MDG9927423.1 hypothetical protein [Pseudomonas sp. GD04042]MDH0482492.1 hypothetical protein [Pseudomonas sp. GD04015]MDH0602844.1 hypothetical protein [Pseudomonas sp. GD03869]
MTTDSQNEFIESLDDTISPEQLDQLLGLVEGDTGAPASEQAAQPGAAKAGEEEGQDGANSESAAAAAVAGNGKAKGQEATSEPELTPDNAVVLAKDGKHVIDYQKLVDARQGEQHWKAEAAAKDARIAELETQAAARAQAGEAPTKTDNQLAMAQDAIEQGVDPAIFGDFSEEALAAGIQKLIDARVDARVDAIVEQKLAPIQQKHANEAANAHDRAIYEAHPDADSIVESKEFATWLDSQPSMARDAYSQVLDKGTASQVIELFGAFKQATGATHQPASPEDDVKRKAQEAIAKAQAQQSAPASLSDIPGGRAAGITREEAMAEMDGVELLESMDDMSREQIDAFLNRL